MHQPNYKLFFGITSMLCLPSSFAGTIIGGNIGSEADAEIVLDLVIGADDSGSIGATELTAVSDATALAIANISCTQKTWVKARTIVINKENSHNVAGTIFDEDAVDVFDETTNTLLEDSTEDIANFANDAINFYPWSTPQAGKEYFKAVLAVADEGLENGEPVSQADYDSGIAANNAAMTNTTSLFVLGLDTDWTTPETFPAFSALTAGTAGVPLGGHIFADTGGRLIEFTNDAVELQQAMEELICTAILEPPTPEPPPATPGAPAAIPSVSIYSLLAMVFSLGFFATWLKRKK